MAGRQPALTQAALEKIKKEIFRDCLQEVQNFFNRTTGAIGGAAARTIYENNKRIVYAGYVANWKRCGSNPMRTISRVRHRRRWTAIPVFVLLVNPETLSRKFEVEYSDGNLPNTNQQPKYFRTKPEEFKLDILFDGTGVVRTRGSRAAGWSVCWRIRTTMSARGSETLKNSVINMTGRRTSLFYVKICWGSTDGFFKGILTGLDIDYKLFRPDGKPIRAMAHLSLISSVHPQTAVLLEDKPFPGYHAPAGIQGRR